MPTEKQNSFTEWLIPLFVSGLLGIVGVVILVFGIGAARDAYASLSWTPTQATVVSFSIDQRKSLDKDNHTVTSYYPRVVYRYQVNDKTYNGDRISFEEEGGTSGARHTYSANQKVTVYYSPNDPQQAVLINGANPLSFWYLGVGLLFALLGVPSTLGILNQMFRRNAQLKRRIA